MQDTFPNYYYENYNDIKHKLAQCKNKYKMAFNKLSPNTSKFNVGECIELKNKCLSVAENFLKEVITVFDEFKQHDVLVFLHGSYARETHTYFSDVDFTMCYDNSLRSVFIPIEELISIAFVEIFNLKKRSKVHPITNNFENYYKEQQPSKITFYFGDEVVSYDQSTYKFQSIYDAINSSREISHLLTIYKDRISNLRADEYCFSFKQIYCNNISLDYAKNINELEGSIIKKVEVEDLAAILDIQVENIKNLQAKKIADVVKVNEMKTIIKDNPNFAFYSVLSVIRRFLNSDFNYGDGLNIKLLENDRIISIIGIDSYNKITTSFYKKNWYLTRFQKMLICNNITLSKANESVLTKQQIVDIYNKEFNGDFSEVEENINQFYSDLIWFISLFKRRILCLK